MDIVYRREGRKWIVEVWSDDPREALLLPGFKEPYAEDTYQEINQWCIDTLKYHARTSYHVFEFKNKKDLEWFLLRWS
jgi:hypothetical protein